MKTILLIITVLFTTLTQAQVYEARPFGELFDRIQKADFTYKETGMIFGFMSVKSCLFASKDIVIFKNYCYPVKKYPARGYTIITRESGIIDLYEEQLDGGPLLREVVIEEFPVYLTPYLQESLPTYTLSDLDGIMRELYPRYNPGCWSTNFSKYTQAADFNCNQGLENVINGSAWAQETQAIVNDEAAWFSLMDAVEAKLKH
jgi:hypothetical protein